MREEDIKAKILSELAGGQRSQSCIVKKLKISPDSVRNELSSLEKEGVIVRRREIETESRRYVFFSLAAKKSKKV